MLCPCISLFWFCFGDIYKYIYCVCYFCYVIMCVIVMLLFSDLFCVAGLWIYCFCLGLFLCCVLWFCFALFNTHLTYNGICWWGLCRFFWLRCVVFWHVSDLWLCLIMIRRCMHMHWFCFWLLDVVYVM